MDALGLLTLALILCLLLAAGAPRPVPSGGPPPRLDHDALAPAERVALGWPVPADCADPEAWEALPGIGPALGGRLAEAAGRGSLTAAPDLLRVHGIGTKMAATLAHRVDFGLPGEPESAR